VCVVLRVWTTSKIAPGALRDMSATQVRCVAIFVLCRRYFPPAVAFSLISDSCAFRNTSWKSIWLEVSPWYAPFFLWLLCGFGVATEKVVASLVSWQKTDSVCLFEGTGVFMFLVCRWWPWKWVFYFHRICLQAGHNPCHSIWQCLSFWISLQRWNWIRIAQISPLWYVLFFRYCILSKYNT